jgi:hypothetical protein
MRRKLFGVLLSGLVCSAGASGSDFSLRLYGGWGYADGGDLNKSINSWREYYSDRRGEEFTSLYNLETMRGASELGAEAALALSRKWSLSLGVGAVFQRTSGQIFTRSVQRDAPLPETGTVDFEQTTEQRPLYTLLSIPVTLWLDYTVVRGERWSLTTGVGGGIYWGHLELEESYNVSSESITEETTAGGIIRYIDRLRTTGEYMEQTTGMGFGVHGRLGVEYRLSPSVFLTASVLGRRVNMKGWRGDRRDASEWQWDYGLWGASSAEGRDERSENGELWMQELREDMTGKSYPILVFGETAPSSGSRQAGISLSGISVRLGLCFKFGGKA